MKKDFDILDRIKLLTNYDSSKTLNENKNIIFEQGQTPQEMANYDNQLATNFKNTSQTKISNSLNPITQYSEVTQNNRINIIADIYRRTNEKGIIIHLGHPLNYTTWSDYVSKNKITQDEIYKAKQLVGNTTEQPTQQQPTQQQPQRSVPQTFEDVVQGKGVLKLGDQSPAVKELQEKLISIDYTVIGTATGYFGKKTQIAVEYFQSNSVSLSNERLNVDLIVGKETANALNRATQLRQTRTQSQQQNQPIRSTQPRTPSTNIQAPTTGIQR